MKSLDIESAPSVPASETAEAENQESESNDDDDPNDLAKDDPSFNVDEEPSDEDEGDEEYSNAQLEDRLLKTRDHIRSILNSRGFDGSKLPIPTIKKPYNDVKSPKTKYR